MKPRLWLPKKALEGDVTKPNPLYVDAPKTEPALKSMIDHAIESSRDNYLAHLNHLVDDSLKDVCGGVVPTPKAKKKGLKGIRHTNGIMFYWKKKQLVFISNPMFRQENGKLQMDVVDRRMYKAPNGVIVKASN